jgi:CxxC motif-containing protein (DUF1111 family)
MSASAPFRMKPAHWFAAALALAPAWKAAEWAWGSPGAKRVDPQIAAAGETLFRHEWTVNDPLASGDGLGPVFNARSCLDCHFQGAPGGGGPLDKNVTVYAVAANKDLIRFSEQRCVEKPQALEPTAIPPVGVVHQKAISPGFQETLAQVNGKLPRVPSLPLSEIIDGKGSSLVPGVLISQRNTPALFGDGLIDAVPDEAIIAHQREHSDAARLVGLNGAKDGLVRGRVARLVDGRFGRFGWKGEFSHLNDFVKAACANEIGLSNPGRPQATPLGKRDYAQKGTDLTDEQCVSMTDFIRSLPVPTEVVPSNSEAAEHVKLGKARFTAIGCADCHSERMGPITGIYSDMLLHDMGIELESSTGYYGSIIPQAAVANDKFAVSEQPTPSEWRTAPLWGIADSGPYLHDGRAESLEQAIELHGGEASDVATRFKEMPAQERGAIVAFLKSLRAPSMQEISDAVAAK